MERVVWTDFSMRPVHPTQGQNPVTRVLNMVKRSDGAIYKRRAVGTSGTTGPAGPPINSLNATIDGVNYLFVKTATVVTAYNTDTGNSNNLSADFTGDPAFVTTGGLRKIIEGAVGSLSIYNGELYYCDEGVVFAWDGSHATKVRRPGVPSLDGLYYDSAFGPGMGFTNPSATLSGFERAYYMPPNWPGVDGSPFNKGVAAGDADPYIQSLGGDSDNAFPSAGQKTLNTAFALSFYDSKRRTYGKRCFAYALPFVFGPRETAASNMILTDERFQYAKYVKTPDPSDIVAGLTALYPEMKVAIWFTPGMQILSNKASTTWELGDGWIRFYGQYAASMSEKMSDVLFLEQIAEPSQNTPDLAVKCDKDNAALFEGGRYIDTYDRPVPAKFMVVLSNGTAVYLFPWIKDDQLAESAVLGQYAEYSVRHPEQLGRLTNKQRETMSPIPGLLGKIQRVVSDGINQLVMTDIAVYQIGFNGQVTLSSVSTRGVRSSNSITTSGVGTLWYADEGVVWMRGGQSVLLDKEIGFGDWFDDLSDADKGEVVVGVSEGTNQVFMVTNDGSDSTSGRIVVFDYERKFASEWSISGGRIKYADYIRNQKDSRFLLWIGGTANRYPEAGLTGEATSVVLWLNDNIDRHKTLTSFKLDFPVKTGSVTVKIDGYESGDVDADQAVAMSVTKTITDQKPGRYHVIDAEGTRAKLFRITITVIAGAINWGLARVEAEFEYEEGQDAKPF